MTLFRAGQFHKQKKTVTSRYPDIAQRGARIAVQIEAEAGCTARKEVDVIDVSRSVIGVVDDHPGGGAADTGKQGVKRYSVDRKAQMCFTSHHVLFTTAHQGGQ